MWALWILVALGAVIGFFELLGVVTASNLSAPQEAGGAAMAVAWAVIPYVFARACHAIVSAEERQLKRLNETLQAYIRGLNPTPTDAK